MKNYQKHMATLRYFVTIQYGKGSHCPYNISGAGHKNKIPVVKKIQSYFFNSWSSSSVVNGKSSGRVASCERSGSSISPSIIVMSKSGNLWNLMSVTHCQAQLLSQFVWQCGIA